MACRSEPMPQLQEPERPFDVDADRYRLMMRQGNLASLAGVPHASFAVCDKVLRRKESAMELKSEWMILQMFCLRKRVATLLELQPQILVPCFTVESSDNLRTLTCWNPDQE